MGVSVCVFLVLNCPELSGKVREEEVQKGRAKDDNHDDHDVGRNEVLLKNLATTTATTTTVTITLRRHLRQFNQRNSRKRDAKQNRRKANKGRAPKDN